MANNAKISKPTIYILLAAVVGGAVFFLLPQDSSPAKKPVAKTVAHSSKPDANGITDEDRKAHFAHYTAAKHDAFLPLVVSKTGIGGEAKPNMTNPLGRGTWVLTGTMALNGSRSALVENSTTSESVFLKDGDRWNGQRVLSVEENDVVLINDKGQKISLTFPPPPDDKSAGATAASPAPVPGGGNPANPAVPGAPAAPANAAAPGRAGNAAPGGIPGRGQ